MLPDRVSNPGPLTYESGTLPIALRDPATVKGKNFRRQEKILFFKSRPTFRRASPSEGSEQKVLKVVPLSKNVEKKH